MSEEESENELDIEIYDTDEEQDDEQNEQMQHLNCHARDTVLENHVTPITDVTNTTSSGGNSGGSSGGTNKENQMHQNNQTNYGANNGTQHGANNAPPNSSNDKPREKKNDKKDSGSRTMEQWLKSDNLTVFPVWIGNLPKGTTVSQLRQFVEGVVGRVLVSIHISTKQTSNDRTYAFLNLPTAEVYLLIIFVLKSVCGAYWIAYIVGGNTLYIPLFVVYDTPYAIYDFSLLILSFYAIDVHRNNCWQSLCWIRRCLLRRSSLYALNVESVVICIWSIQSVDITNCNIFTTVLFVGIGFMKSVHTHSIRVPLC